MDNQIKEDESQRRDVPEGSVYRIIQMKSLWRYAGEWRSAELKGVPQITAG